MLNLSEIIETINRKGLTAYEIAKETSLTEAGILKILNGESKNPRKSTLEILNNFLNKYNNTPTIREDAVKETDAVWVGYSNFMKVPMVTHRAQAGFLSGWGDQEYLDELPTYQWEVDREYRGKYICFEVSGDSMDDGSSDALLDGDLILCREIQRVHWHNKLHINQWDFVIVHRERGIVVKRVTEHDTETHTLKLHSLNAMYEDYEVSLNDIIAIFNVVDFKRSKRR